MPSTARAPQQAGFTLIELLISTGLLAMLLLTISSLFMTFLLGSAATNGQQTLKTEGTTALTQVEYLVRNARRVVSDDCAATPINTTSLTLEGIDGGTTVLSADGTRVASQSSFPSSATVSTYYLTSDQVELEPSDMTFRCRERSGNRLVEVEFTLRDDSPSTDLQESTTSKVFTAAIEVRNQ